MSWQEEASPQGMQSNESHCTVHQTAMVASWMQAGGKGAGGAAGLRQRGECACCAAPQEVGRGTKHSTVGVDVPL